MDNQRELLNTTETVTRLKYDPRTIQRWCKEGRFASALKVGREWRIPEEEVERYQRGEANTHLKFQEVQRKKPASPQLSESLIHEIKKLAQRIKQLTNVPKPEVPLLPDDIEDEKKILDKSMEGDSHPVLSTIITASIPWFSNIGLVKIQRHLEYEQEALWEYILSLPQIQTLRELIVEWEDNANNYVNLKRSHSNPDEIEAAYHIADDTSRRLNLELRKIIITLSTNQT
jgi:excisionase family DNA binding protein